MKYIKFVCFGFITNQTHTTPKQTVPLEDAKDRTNFFNKHISKKIFDSLINEGTSKINNQFRG